MSDGEGIPGSETWDCLLDTLSLCAIIRKGRKLSSGSGLSYGTIVYLPFCKVFVCDLIVEERKRSK